MGKKTTYTIRPGSPPTRRCVICRKLEIPNAGTIINSFWFCPTCAYKTKTQILRGGMTVGLQERSD